MSMTATFEPVYGEAVKGNGQARPLTPEGGIGGKKVKVTPKGAASPVAESPVAVAPAMEKKKRQRVQPVVRKEISTNWAVRNMVIVAAAAMLLFYFATANRGALDVVGTLGDLFVPRMVANIVIVAIAALVSVAFIALFMPQVWAWFHNRINTKLNFKSDWEKCSAEYRLSFFSQQFWYGLYAFLLALLVIFQ